MGLRRAWQRCRMVHTTFFLICFTFVFYANLQDPIARSLVICDQPLETGNFTGSLGCGDRNLVIERGQDFMSCARATRLAVTLCSCTAMGAISDIYGRRAFILLYTFAMLIAVSCHIVAPLLVPTATWWVFMASSAFTGFFSIDQNGYRLILADMAEQDHDKSELGELLQFQALIQAVGSASGVGASLVVNSLHLESYQQVAVPVAGLLCCCLLLEASLEETRPPGKRDVAAGERQQSLKVTAIESYRLLKGSVYLRKKLPLVLCGGVLEAFGPLLNPWTMAVYGWEQEAVGKLIVMGAPMALICMGLSLPVAERLGERRTVTFCLALGILVLPVTFALLPISPKFLHMAHLVFMINQTGTRSLLSAVDMQLTEEDIRARFQSTLSVGKMFVSMMMQPCIAWLFDALGQDYLTQVRPMLVLAVVVFITNFMQLFSPLGPMYMEALDAITAERLAKRKKAESGEIPSDSDPQPSEEKKKNS